MLPVPRASSVPVFVTILIAACGGGNAASKLADAPEYNPKDQTKCGVAKSQAKPLIVEWPSPERMELENKVRQGLVVVRYVGCEMSVLDRCSVAAKYIYQGATRNQDRLEMKDEDDLYAHLPVGAAGLEATLQRTGRLTVDMNLVGRFEAERPSVSADELQGDCTGATHFVYGVTVGAFDFYAGGQASVGADAGIGNFGAGGHSQAERETLTKAGDQAACEKAAPDDKAPPAQCGALIRIEVVPLGEAKPYGPSSAAWQPRPAPAPTPTSAARAPAPVTASEPAPTASIARLPPSAVPTASSVVPPAMAKAATDSAFDTAFVEVGPVGAQGVRESAVRGALHGVGLAGCYRAALKARGARATGVATLSLAIDESGVVHSAIVTGAGFLPGLGRCLQGAALRASVSESQVDPGGGTAEITLEFRTP